MQPSHWAACLKPPQARRSPISRMAAQQEKGAKGITLIQAAWRGYIQRKALSKNNDMPYSVTEDAIQVS